MGYRDSIEKLAEELPINRGSFLITGATGLIGSCLIDVLVAANKKGSSFKIFALGRSKERIIKRFGIEVVPVEQDIATPLE